MEPRIQYAKTGDGVSIAYWTLGEGPPLVWMQAPPFSHLQLEWELPLYRRTFEKLARGRQLVRYDPRGCGLSDGDVANFSLELHILDLRTVVAKLGLERFALVAITDAGPIAVSYAARNPRDVAHLVLWGAYARGGFEDASQIQALHALMDRDWQLFTEAATHAMFGWSAGEQGKAAAHFMARCTTREAVKAVWDASGNVDVTESLPEVLCPTLVLHPSHVPWVDIDQSRLLASRISKARLIVLEDLSGVFHFDESGATVTAIEEFLAEGGEPAPPPELPSGTAVSMFADIADSTGLTERLGDAAFREKARALDGRLRGVIRENGGRPVDGKLLGDGVLAVFTSARQAIEAALACGRAGNEAGLALHLGLHAGDVIREEGNVYGGAVNIAARISALSAPGELLVSETLRGLARTSAGVSFGDRGERELKGMGEPVRVWAVRAGEGE